MEEGIENLTIFEYCRKQNLDRMEAVRIIDGYRITQIVEKLEEEE